MNNRVRLPTRWSAALCGEVITCTGRRQRLSGLGLDAAGPATPGPGSPASARAPAWWPRASDLPAELPQLLSGLPRGWGRILSVRVNGTVWTGAPARMIVRDQVVRVGGTTTAHPSSTVVPMAPGHGRRDLLVVPPEATGRTAASLVSAAGSTAEPGSSASCARRAGRGRNLSRRAHISVPAGVRVVARRGWCRTLRRPVPGTTGSLAASPKRRCYAR
ncbi:DUF5994 family protein [Streptomyces sp. NPDC059467]|uniref:DUF5994 family protein n=1 Tax=Streptomyces sp. NPDC059467 TaxID=3346844 RepID=UPI0036767485